MWFVGFYCAPFLNGLEKLVAEIRIFSILEHWRAATAYRGAKLWVPAFAGTTSVPDFS
jgi:hypothetical protein